MTPSESSRPSEKPEGVMAPRRRRPRFPWLLLLLLLASVYGFWIYPWRSPPSPVRVEWKPAPISPVPDSQAR